MAQQNQIREIVRVDFPVGTIKLPRQEDFQTLLGDWSHDSVPRKLPLFKNGEFYRIDSFLLALHGERRNAPKHYLENLKKDFDGLAEQSEANFNQTSEIKKINNYSVLITNIDSRDWGSFFFSL
jgi:hypothetical protein